MKEILMTALNKMPNEFNSNEFAAACRKLGLSETRISSGNCAFFLHKTCEQTDSCRQWIKKTAMNNNDEVKKVDAAIKSNEVIFTIENCTAFLKANGCKVLKQEFIEL